MKENFAALLVPKGGLPEATEKMKELADTLKDPAVIAAADHLTSFLITGFATVAKYIGQVAAGLSLVLNGPAQASMRIDDRMRALQNESDSLKETHYGRMGGNTMSDAAKQRQLDITKELIVLAKQYDAALAQEYAADNKAAAAAQALADAKQRINDIKARGITLSYDLKKSMDQVDAGGEFLKQFDQADKAAEKLTRTAVENQIQTWNEYFDSLNLLRAHDLIDEKTYNERSRDYIDQNLQEVQVSVKSMVLEHKKATDQMSEFANQAARNIQDSFANFLFDPFHNGLKGMLADFLNVIRRMTAEIAAAQLFGKGSAGGGWLSGLIGGLLGAGGGGGGGGGGGSGGGYGGAMAAGGSVSGGTTYMVGENGPELFTPRTSGSIAPNSALSGGKPTVVLNQSLNFANNVQDRSTLVVWAEQIRKQTISDMTGLIRGGAFS